MFRVIRLLLVLILIAAIGAAGFLYFSLGTPYAGFKAPVFVDIPPGTSSRTMSEMLQQAGIIKSSWQFQLARALNARKRLQAGEYRFAEPASVWTIFQRIARGDIFYYELRVPEGSNQYDIAAAIEELGFMKATQFLKVSADPKMIHDLDPKAPTLEGYLFPATYRITRHTTAPQIAKEMTDRFRRAWKELNGTDVHTTVTLASLVEKEARVPEDRPNIASVFTNRLERGMTLDCDPTTIYAALLEGRYRGTIYRSDLASDNLYNTYRHAGLPPGPIANPGMESLKAALHPAQTSYLFFVVKPGANGRHTFTSNINDHNAAVAEYRRGVHPR